VNALARSQNKAWFLPAVLVLGLAIRLALITSAGFKNDIGLFAAWAGALAEHPFSQFYVPERFADYPPGYLYVLWFVGFVWELLFKNAGSAYAILDALVKIPAIVADLLVGGLLYRLVSRYASAWWALGAAALYVLNPATIVVSAVWGQIDAISGGLALLSVYLLMRAGDRPEKTLAYICGAWIVLATSLLIKPQAALLLPLLVAFAFVDVRRRKARLAATGVGIACAVVLAGIVAVPFHPTVNPFDLATWLIGRYAYGASYYAYSSVNAFNLWSVFRPFWQPDTTRILFLPQVAFGALLALVATGLAVWRYLQLKTATALLECSALVLLAFFMLSTRMHERYIFDGLLFTIACVALSRRYLWAAVIFSGVLIANLGYSLEYLQVMDQHLPLNSSDLWGPLDHVLSFVNVATFFWLGYVLLGRDDAAEPASVAVPPPAAAPKPALPDPNEGSIGMRGWIDWAIAGGLGAFSFVLSFVNYWLPPEKIFDEVYFPRAAEEYLKHLPIYENTHPPLTKLIITFSIVLFGGLQGGDTPWGWRFMDVLFGALVVALLYIFAKHLTGSRVFAAIASLLLTFDGMHFVQSRIATPEGIVVFFSLAALYLFYRFWLSARSNVEAERSRYEMAACAALSLIAGFAVSWGIAALLDAIVGYPQSTAATIVAGVYLSIGIYLLLRAIMIPRIRKQPAPKNASSWMWLLLFSAALGCLVASKWYGVMAFGVSFVVLVGVWAQRYFVKGDETPPWGNPRGFRLDVTLCAIVFIASTVYALTWMKDLMNQADIHNLTEIVYRQYTMYMYHHNLTATHPYSSKWWQWPLDLRPVYYYAKFGNGVRQVIYSLPNPVLLWFGLFSVPYVGYLAWRERSKGYAVVVITYLLQWLPWMASPRIAFAYHFYVDIPLICICNAIALQRFWENARAARAWYGIPAVAGYVVLAGAAFAFFYPILAAVPISDAYWNLTQWLPSWS
jgi:dolichyl-phosphate-mannose--protein O-mannosyl transferase